MFARVVFYFRGEIGGLELVQANAPHGALGVLFAIAFFGTKGE